MSEIIDLSEKVDSRQAFKYLYKCWKLLGVYPGEYCKYSFIPIWGFVASLPLTVTIFLFYLENFQEILFNLSVNVTIIACAVKYTNILLKRQTILDVNDIVESLDARLESLKEQALLKDAVRFANRIFRLTFVMFSGACLLLELGALASRGKRLIFSAWFPFDWKASSSNYIMAHMHQLIALSFDVVLNVSCDTYPAIYMHILTCHVHALNMRVRRIASNPDKSSEENYKDLVRCIQDHQLLRQYFFMVERVTSIPIFFQFFVTGVEACITAVSVFFVQRSVFGTTFLAVYFVCVITEIFLFCHFGNELIDESRQLTNAIYSCNWIDQNPKFKKTLTIFMQSTQKTMTVRAGGYVPVSTPTFLSVLRSSYSLFAVLMNVA